MKKNLYTAIFFLVFNLLGFSQILDPIDWSAKAQKTAEDTYEIQIKAHLDPHWHLYSQHVAPGGPIPTQFDFTDAVENYKLLGETSEPQGIENYDGVFEMDIKYFETEAVFTQKIALINPYLSAIRVDFTYMVCDDTRCLPPTTETYEIPLDGSPASEIIAEATEETANGLNQIFQNQLPVNNLSGSIKDTATQKPTPSSSSSLWSIFIIAFLSGFAALLTPCVFPMIPLTVSYFTKQNAGNRASSIRDAVFYGLSIVFIYVLLGTLVTAIFGADVLNVISTNVWFNLAFFVLLVVFAISFLGAFEIVLPSSWANMADRQADKRGLIGILFMALALAIVSFSCTGPIVGTLLVQAATQGGWAPAVGMLGFSSALALPFMLFAMFPNWLQSLPKSGGWMQTVKVTLGFLELALAFKFLSNADLVLQLHYLEREVFLAIWIAVFGALSLYLLGAMKLSHDSPSTGISTGRLGFGLLTLAFTIYLIPGLWGAPLKIISGFPPPLTYSESPTGIGTSSVLTDEVTEKGMSLGPHGIKLFKDYDLAMAYAQKVNKPLMIDFTGHACVNCRKMEDYVWSEPHILKRLKEEIVLVSLYVDDQRALPQNEQFVSAATGKKIKTIGNKWSEFQITRYQTNAQPYYVLVNSVGDMLNAPIGYVDAQVFENWLKEGISAY
ncbi:MAG: cytochrome c biogenesis protein CcdA [Flavobacteriaceae bacterium]|nr:cytochrome c biogenesis protein CcdA [Flavobacteriaceae bacterium]